MRVRRDGEDGTHPTFWNRAKLFFSSRKFTAPSSEEEEDGGGGR